MFLLCSTCNLGTYYISLVFYDPLDNFSMEGTVKEIHNFYEYKNKKQIAINYKNGR